MWLVPFLLKLALQLHANLDRLEWMRRGDGSAGGDATGNECPARTGRQ
jgi:hypothetical protein